MNTVLFPAKTVGKICTVCKPVRETPCSTLDQILDYFGVFQMFQVV